MRSHSSVWSNNVRSFTVSKTDCNLCQHNKTCSHVTSFSVSLVVSVHVSTCTAVPQTAYCFSRALPSLFQLCWAFRLTVPEVWLMGVNGFLGALCWESVGLCVLACFCLFLRACVSCSIMTGRDQKSHNRGQSFSNKNSKIIVSFVMTCSWCLVFGSGNSYIIAACFVFLFSFFGPLI